MTSSSPTSSDHHDVVVVGARCAGAATAFLLAARGVDVAVIDRAALPTDTLSTHAIARGGVVQLARWGLLDDVLATGAPAVREVTFRSGDDEVRRVVKDRAGVDLLVAPRRWALDAVLADAAVAAGATLRTGTTVTGLLRDPSGRVRGITARGRSGREVRITARHVVGADGVRSATAAMVGGGHRRWVPTDSSTYYAYVDQVPWTGFEFHIAPAGFAGVFPTHDGQAAVWLCRPTALVEQVRSAGARRCDALLAAIAEVSPSLARRVRAGRVVSRVRGTVDLPGFVRDAYGPGWALVGDAGYHRDPITGHGITDAFRDAELLADALSAALGGQDEHQALEAYQTARDEALQDVFRITAALARYPHPDRFACLQVELAEALDREALLLASRPAPAGLRAAPAA